MKGPDLAEKSKRSKSEASADPVKGPILCAYDKACKQEYYRAECNLKNRQESDHKRKRMAKSSPAYSQSERESNSERKRNKRHEHKHIAKKCLKFEDAGLSNIAQKSSILRFRAATAVGCDYVCTVCHQTWFKRSVSEVTNSLRTLDLAHTSCMTGELSVDVKEWICCTCSSALLSRRVPTLSVKQNGMAFPDVPPLVADLRPLEERLVCPRQVFMTMQELPRGGQISVRGNVVNVPVDVAPTIRILPRNISDSGTIGVKMKKRKRYKTAVFHENIHPVTVARAVELLCETPLYQKEGIKLDSDWKKRLHEDDCTLPEFIEKVNVIGTEADSNVDSPFNNLKHVHMDDSNIPASPKANPNTNEPHKLDLLQTAKRPDNKKASQVDDEVKQSSDGDISDNFSEVDVNEHNGGTRDTLLDSPDYSNRTLVLAPGEDKKPSSLYHNTNAEYLAFPTIYGGHEPPPNPKKKVTYSQRSKWECRHKSGKIGKSVPNLFFKMKKLQLKQITDRVSLAVRRVNGKQGEKITAGDVKTDGGAKLVKLDDGFEIFKSIRNSPPYLERRKRDVFAMIRQLGKPAWFFSLSAADTKWPALLKSLAKCQWNRDLSDEDVENLSWEERSKLVRNDPITCSRYFENRCREFIKLAMGENEPLGKVSDFFYRVEFQQRGSPHIHGLFWVDGAPSLDTHSEEQVCDYIDQFISCSHDVTDEDRPYLDLQRHRHSKTCRKKGKTICRFNYPLPPMRSTRILSKLDDDEKEDNETLKQRYAKIETKLGELWKKERDFSFDEFLEELGMTEEQYVKTIRSSLRTQTTFLKRQPNEIRINAYIKNLLGVWQANHDIQYCLDAYACAVYIVAYISKSQRGMSLLLDAAVKEARTQTSSIREQVRHIGNKFTNAVEIGSQESAYLVLGMPLTKASRKVTFISTAPTDERTFLLKSKEELEHLPDDSTDIAKRSVLDAYMERPNELASMCYADFVSRTKVTKKTMNKTAENDVHEEEDDFVDDEFREEDNSGKCSEEWEKHLPLTLSNGNVLKLKKNPEVIRSIGYNEEIDSEKHYREILMLYSSWRQESDLQLEGSSQMRYESVKNEVDARRRRYDPMGRILEEAKKRVVEEYPDQFTEVAPGTEYDEAVDADEGREISEEFALYLPQTKQQENYDIGIEFNRANTEDEVEIQARILTDEQFYAGVRTLNKEQREFFTHILQSTRDQTEPYAVFLSGGAGVGKSHVINMLYQALHRELARHPGDNPDDQRILLCIPTGKAAFNIQGSTIHSAFQIRPNQALSPENQRLGESQLNTSFEIQGTFNCYHR